MLADDDGNHTLTLTYELPDYATRTRRSARSPT